MLYSTQESDNELFLPETIEMNPHKAGASGGASGCQC
jgi:hypothetical protein